MNTVSTWMIDPALVEAMSQRKDKSNLGFGFGSIAKRLKGRVRGLRNQGRYNVAKRTTGLRFWTPEQWQAYCKATPKDRR